MFGIPACERKKFKDSFLRSLSMTVKYELNSEIEQGAIDIYPTIKDEYPVKSPKSISSIRVGDNIRMVDRDTYEGQVVYKSDDASEEIRYSSSEFRMVSMLNEYSGFEPYLSKFDKLMQPLKDSGISEINGISLVKLNALNFRLKVDETTRADNNEPIYRMAPISKLLRKGLIMNEGISQTLNSGIIKYQNSINLEGEKGYYLTIDFDTSITNIAPDGNTVDGVVSIQFHIRRNSSIDISSVHDEYLKLNQEVFNAFMWILSDYGKELLNNVG